MQIQALNLCYLTAKLLYFLLLQLAIININPLFHLIFASFKDFTTEAAVSTNQGLKSLDLGEGQPRSMSEDLE